MNLAALAWDYATWRDIVGRNPYGRSFPLVVRADWLLYELADAHQSDAYYRLMLGSVPKTRDEFLAAFGVISDRRHAFGLIEGSRGVSLQGTRWIESLAIPRGYAWRTRDVLRVVDAFDPLEHPRGDFKHDGEEIILGIPKLHATSGARGALQVYGLFDGNGRFVTRAPIDLVRDSTRFAGFDEIRAPGSCVQCHAAGLNDPTTNALRDVLAAGVALDSQSFADLAAFHLSDVGTEIARNQEDYATAVQAVTGLAPVEASAAFHRSIDRYLESVGLERAAAELGVTQDRLRATLELASQAESIGVRSASLARGRSIRRETFAELFLTFRLLLGELPLQKAARVAKPVAAPRSPQEARQRPQIRNTPRRARRAGKPSYGRTGP
jgi:hypothetical protein